MAEVLTGGESGWNYGAAPVEVEQGDSGEFPGVEAELARCLAGALVQRGGVATAAQRSGAGQSKAGWGCARVLGSWR